MSTQHKLANPNDNTLHKYIQQNQISRLIKISFHINCKYPLYIEQKNAVKGSRYRQKLNFQYHI